ncbi:MAG: F0F1 ATP synthase subunit A [Chloroflexi bacterium]|nr:F0F1 ATP synthase subunit A [Chloroflexota bacterium]
MSSETTKRRIPVKRWIVLALILIGVYTAFLGPTFLRPVSPAVVLPGEPTGLAIGGFQITNTLLATLIGDVALIVCALIIWSFSRGGKLVPEGFYGFLEFLIEFLWSSAEGAAGSKWARRIFPWTATIFLLVFAVNMTKLVPGFESIGRLEAAHGSVKGYAPVKLFSLGELGVYTLDAGKLQPAAKEEKTAEAKPAEAGHATTELCKSCEVIPFLRGAPTDLNFTFAGILIQVL